MNIEEIRKNIFPGAHNAISDWDKFDWHDHAQAPNSSQALAIDVFGTIKASPPKDQILNQLAGWLDLPGNEKWEVELEWTDPENLLKESKRQTQIDAIAISSRAIIIFECKFTEGGGNCSQPEEQKCNGNYEIQVNPENGKEAKCALTGKGIRYWDYIEKVFREIDPTKDYKPCPFKDENYQWMRNLVLCKALIDHENKKGAVVAVYADGDMFKMSKKIKSKNWTIDLNGKKPEFMDSLKSDINFKTLSYQSLIEMILECSSSKIWHELKEWVEKKLDNVSLKISNEQGGNI